MERTQAGIPEANQILTDRHRAVLLLGPARAGKSTCIRRLAAATSDRAGCLILAPNAPAVAEIRRRLLAESPAGALPAPRVMTFASLAGRILAGSPEPPRAISAFDRHLLLRQIVERLLAAGQLQDLAASARTPGFIQAVARSIAELKRAAIDPAGPGSALSSAGRIGADLQQIYEAYQQALQDTRQVDTAGTLWLGRDELLRRDREGLDLLEMDLDCIAVDGFTTFSPTQLQILHLLSGWVRPVVVALPWADQEPRGKLWSWTKRTSRSLAETFGDQLRTICLQPEQTTGLGQVCRRLFDPQAEPVTGQGLFQIVEAPDPETEVRHVARRIKALLAGGAPAGSIAILARNLEPYRPTLQAVLSEHDIPTAPRPEPLTGVPVIRFVLHLAQLWPDLEAPAVLETLKNSYFQPDRLGPFGPEDQATAEMLIAEGNVLAGLASYRQAAERVIEALSGRSDSDEADRPARIRLGALHVGGQSVTRALEMLEAIFALARQAAEGDLQAVIDRLDLASAVIDPDDPPRTARDLRALEALTATLAPLDPERRPSPSMLAEALAALPLAPPRTESLVDVYDFLDARALRYEHVFLIGCSAGLLPASPSPPVLLPEAHRAQWARQGLVLETREQLADREMLLMYLAVSRADSSLTVSYPVGSAGDASASSYVLALAETQGGPDSHTVQSNTLRIPAGQFLPAPRDLASRREAAIAAVAGLFRSGHDPRGRALAWLRAGRDDQIDQIARGLWMRHCRWQPGPCDRFDGRITEPDLLEVLAERFPGRTVFSASQLNRYASCPWQFFAQYVLQLKPLPQAERLLEPVNRGLFCHDVLCRLMTLLGQQSGGPVALDLVEPDALAAALDQAVQAASEAVERQGCAYPVLWRIQRDQLAEALARYVKEKAACSRLEPTHLHFELGFGLAGQDRQDPCDPASTAEPVTLETPAGAIRCRGRIDRVDRVRFDGVDALAAVDYKTGALPGTDDVREGLDLQLPLYALALEALTGQEVFGGSMDQVLTGSRRWFAPFSSYEKMDPDWPDLHRRLDQARARIGQLVEGMAAGRFDLLAEHQCAGWCPYRQICHHSPARAEIKAPGREDRDG